MPVSKIATRKLAAGALLLALAGAAWYAIGSSRSNADLINLDAQSFPQLKKAFNDAAGGVRVIVLLSPT